MKSQKDSVKCPYCGAILEKRPTRKKKCQSCQNYIYVKTLPKTREKVLTTEQEARMIEEEWSRIAWRQRWGDQLASLGMSGFDFEKAKAKHISKSGVEVSDHDIVWSIFNKLTVEKAGDFQLLHRIYHSMALFLDEEGRDFKPLLEQAARAALIDYRQKGIKRVRILAAKNSCQDCQAQDGKIYVVEVALDSMPLPCQECTKPGISGQSGFCRCSYVAVFDAFNI